MDYCRLDELIAEKKKGEASKKKIIEYNNEITELLNEEGLSENARKYIWGGLRYNGTTAFSEWLSTKEPEERLHLTRTLLSGSGAIKRDRLNKIIMLFSLLCHGLNNFSEDIGYTEEIIIWILEALKSGGKEGEDHKAINKFFVIPLKSVNSLPEINKLKISAESLQIFKDYLTEKLNEILNNHKTVDYKLNDIIRWVSETSEKQETAKESSPEIADKQEKEEQGPGLVRKTLYLLMNNIQSINNELDKANKVTEENSKLKNDIEKLNENYNERVELLIKSLSDRESVIMEMSKEIAELKEEISRLRGIASVYSEDKENSKNEMLNSIAAKLKAEYGDFKDAADMEMTTDLGENLRLQLKKVFRILEKSGIDIESR